MTELEAEVIEAAQELVICWEGAKYGPMQNEVRKAELHLIEVVSALAAEHEGIWRNPL